MKIESEKDRWLLARIARTGLGDVLRPLDPRPEDQLHDRTDDDGLQEPVEQHASLVNCQTREPEAGITIGRHL